MHDPLPDPLAVLKLAADKAISEEQAATAMNWAARMTVDAWHEYADFWGQSRDDLLAMDRWLTLLGDSQMSLLDDAVSMVLGAESILEELYRESDSENPGRQARAIRTNRPRIHIR
ncbi:hypothetical protein [Streptomyces regalis]|uniref:Uncharacterized protein n=1 Tax=Streptomyces regalis TaxID=68262 RepID=A0A101JAH9_9ACTN|nr:hypothetical protein [Streptomyces regalis]KUL23206.1 hypothetical protein ADL12_39695 [Streptomyces regalis]